MDEKKLRNLVNNGPVKTSANALFRSFEEIIQRLGGDVNKKGNAQIKDYSKNLVAYHNTTEEKLNRALNSGGLAVPSIAITKKDIPFGHFGEDCLNGLMDQKEGQNAPKKFWHERNSLFFADYIETLPDPDAVEKRLDLTYAVRDGIICHCGEIDQKSIKPRNDAIALYSIKRPGLIQPYTWEGCVVKIADKIAYLGRDIEDARAYHILDMGAYRHIREIVATTLSGKGKAAFRSGKAVNTTVLINDLIMDLCEQSSPEKGLCFSEEYFRFILELKKFNFAHIYNHWRLKEFQHYASDILGTIYRTLMRTQVYVQNGRLYQALKYYPDLNKTFGEWLTKYAGYRDVNARASLEVRSSRFDTEKIFDVNDVGSFSKCVIEYISGMTDLYAMKVYEEMISF